MSVTVNDFTRFKNPVVQLECCLFLNTDSIKYRRRGNLAKTFINYCKSVASEVAMTNIWEITSEKLYNPKH